MNTVEILAVAVSVVSLLTTVVGGAMAWQKIKDNREDDRRRLDEIEERTDGHDGLTLKLAVLVERLDWIQRELRRRNGTGTEHHKRDDTQDT
jgi:hypothetical protein